MLMVFENRIPKRIFAPESDENGESRRLYNKELQSVYRSPNISQGDFKVLTDKPTGKRPLEIPRHRWEDNIKLDLKEIGINARNWVDSDQDGDF